MKNYANIIENSNNVIKSVAASLRDANREYTSISSVLKDIQRSQYLKAGYAEVFAAVGINTEAGRLTPADFFAKVHKDLHGTDKKGNDFVGIWGTKKDKETGLTAPILRKVTSWTPRKVFLVLAQSIEAAK